MNIKNYRWKLRFIRVNIPNYKDKRYKKTKKIYESNIKEFHKRYVKMITKLTNNFKIELIGFDGKVKHIYDKLNPEQVFADIEEMPMGNVRNKEKTNLSLFADYDKKNTIEGLGFKDKEKAEYTINRIKNKPIKYQINVVNTMLGRAKSHPYQTKGMKDAIKVYEEWINDYKKSKQSGGEGNLYYKEYLKLKEIYINLKRSSV